MRYAELQVTSHFSFLRGASSAEELFATAAALGIEALAVADRNSVAGIVRAHEAAKATGVRLIIGCRLDLVDGMADLEVGFGGRQSQFENQSVDFVENDDNGETLTDGMFDDGFGVAHDSLDDIDDKDKTVS